MAAARLTAVTVCLKETPMPLNLSMIENLYQWCATTEELADARASARSHFFGYEEPGAVRYPPGAENVNSRERRFVGWFCFSFRMPDGKHPAEMAASALLSGAGLISALKSIRGARYVMAVVTMVKPGKGVYLKPEDEEFEVESRILSHNIRKDDGLCAHILPAGRSLWLVGPGWLVWPVWLGPGIRSSLKQFQLDPLRVERFLQRRIGSTEGRPLTGLPEDELVSNIMTFYLFST